MSQVEIKSEEPPSGSVFLPCGECKKTVAISAEGAAKLEEARAKSYEEYKRLGKGFRIE